jgi:hypothetical protein
MNWKSAAKLIANSFALLGLPLPGIIDELPRAKVVVTGPVAIWTGSLLVPGFCLECEAPFKVSGIGYDGLTITFLLMAMVIDPNDPNPDWFPVGMKIDEILAHWEERTHIGQRA